MSESTPGGRLRGSRRYQLRRRAERQEETRRAIVQATGELHRAVGPARTTIKAIAETAGVERETVYRHFPDMASLVQACGARFVELVAPPDPGALAGIGDPVQRLRAGLAHVYAYYARAGAGLERVLRDREVMPAEIGLGAPVIARIAEVRSFLLAAWPPPTRTALLEPVIGHALDFWTWRSLVQRQGVGEEQAVDLMAALVELSSRQGFKPQ